MYLQLISSTCDAPGKKPSIGWLKDCWVNQTSGRLTGRAKGNRGDVFSPFSDFVQGADAQMGDPGLNHLSLLGFDLAL